MDILSEQYNQYNEMHPKEEKSILRKKGHPKGKKSCLNTEYRIEQRKRIYLLFKDYPGFPAR